MKRRRSYSPEPIHPEQHEPVPKTPRLTHDALKEHDLNTQAVSTAALLEMNPAERIGSLSDIPILPPPSTTQSPRRSRSSSPSRLSDAQYRRGPLRRANIFLDDRIPDEIRHYVNTRVLNEASHDKRFVQQVADKLWSTSQELVRKPSGESEWTEALHTAINSLRPPDLEIVLNRDWRGDIKPPVHNPPPTIPQKRTQSRQPPLETSTTDNCYPSPHLSHPFEAAPPLFKLKDPRPDICVGLSEEGLARGLAPQKGRRVSRSLLFDLQDTSKLISDPHVTSLDLRFPFLIVEAKAGATGGNLYQAQNQAAVAGSTALQICKSLLDLERGQVSRLYTPNRALKLAFSVTTEGPVHELWIHFRDAEEQEFYMGCIGTWRITLKEGSLDFVRYLSSVLRWGSDELRDAILEVLLDM